SWLEVPQAIMFDHVYNLPKWYYPESLQEQRKEIMLLFEKNFTDYLIAHSEIFDKVTEVMFNSCRPFEIFSLYFFLHHIFVLCLKFIKLKIIDKFIYRTAMGGCKATVKH